MDMRTNKDGFRQIAAVWRAHRLSCLWALVGVIGIVAGGWGQHAAVEMERETARMQATSMQQTQALAQRRARMRMASQKGDVLAELVADCDDYHAKLIGVEEGVPTDTDLWRQTPIELTMEIDYLRLIELLSVWESGTPWRDVHLLRAASVAGGARTVATVQVVSYRFIGAPANASDGRPETGKIAPDT